jgi:hypothetical protein
MMDVLRVFVQLFGMHPVAFFVVFNPFGKADAV